MRKAYAIRHVAFEDLGSLRGILEQHNYDIGYIDAGRDRLPVDMLTSADVLIVLGGPISANDETHYPFLAEERRIIAQRIEQQSPTLGLCLGAQLIARALQAEVRTNGAAEIGWSELELTEAGNSSCLQHLQGVKVLHWHGETFTLPTGAQHLASTTITVNQAFQLGHHTLALQFHPEVTAAGLEGWYIGHNHELDHREIDINALRQQSHEYAALLQPAAHACFNHWLEQIE